MPFIQREPYNGQRKSKKQDIVRKRLMIMSLDKAKIVYSTEHDNTCPSCGKTLKNCNCKENKQPKKAENKTNQPKDGVVRVSRETKGRKGKGVTLITGLPITLDQMKELSKELKQKCGTGGTVKNAVIEIQGDHRDAIVDLLQQKGFTAKRAGG